MCEHFRNLNFFVLVFAVPQERQVDIFLTIIIKLYQKETLKDNRGHVTIVHVKKNTTMADSRVTNEKVISYGFFQVPPSIKIIQ